jgi:hypothetical protein
VQWHVWAYTRRCGREASNLTFEAIVCQFSSFHDTLFTSLMCSCTPLVHTVLFMLVFSAFACLCQNYNISCVTLFLLLFYCGTRLSSFIIYLQNGISLTITLLYSLITSPLFQYLFNNFLLLRII